MIKTLVQRHLIFNGSCMIPSQSGLWPAWDVKLDVHGADARSRFGRPSLIRERNAAWGEPRGPNRFDRVGAFLEIQASSSDGKELVIYSI